MRVLDANFLVDYLGGVPATRAYYEQAGGADERWILPAPAYAETLVGVGNHQESDVAEAIAALSWGHVHEIDDELAVEAAHIADEIGPQGPYLDGVDALVAAVGRELRATVVSADSDLTHDATKQVIDVDDYRE